MSRLLTDEHRAAISRTQRRRFQGPTQFGVQTRDFEEDVRYDHQSAVIEAFREWVRSGCPGQGFRIRMLKRRSDSDE